MEEKMMQE